MTDKKQDPDAAPGTDAKEVPRGDPDWRSFFRTATEPLALDLEGIRVHGNYCGTWGSGPILDATDEACFSHDVCYGAAEVNGVTRTADLALPVLLTPEQREAADACDAELCEDLTKVKPTSVEERVDRALIQALFECGPGGQARSGPER